MDFLNVFCLRLLGWGFSGGDGGSLGCQIGKTFFSSPPSLSFDESAGVKRGIWRWDRRVTVVLRYGSVAY